MKRLFIYFVLMLATITSVFAQIPQTFSYQAIVRDTENKIVANKQVYVYIYILQGSDEGSEIYSENHVVTTNQNGLMTLELGGGKTAYDFSSIDWSKAPYFVKTVTNVDGKLITGITPLLAVPYALYAAKTDLSDYYSKKEVDALLAALESKIEKGNENSNDNGAIKAAFSVSADKKVYFSKGNLQFQASTGTWRFAENQYDMIGDDNANISETYEGWIDLFGWGTSGWNSGANAYQSYSTSTVSEDYYPGGSYSNNLTDNFVNADWGVYNKILNGGNQTELWRTLTYDEWDYLINTRTNASNKIGVATVNGVNGLILLPDEWSTPADVTFTSGFSENYYGSEYYATVNNYSMSEWRKMNENGAVFLPADGLRYDTNVRAVGFNGYYWSCSAYNFQDARCVLFQNNSVSIAESRRQFGYSVRLVQDVK
ncbi:MAG: hypothetical protein J6W37_07710 [Bacteroidales bacterium]|nr:hypothetical protein [Bacteroidales bacterium]